MTTIQAHIHQSLETKDSYSQAAIEGAALRGELGVERQLRAMSARALALRAAGDESGYQAVKAEAYKIYEGSK
jgi:hypothetical protein